MTKPLSPSPAVLADDNEYELEDMEIDISGLLKGSLSFPGEQYFNGIMLEKMQPKKVAKFKVSRRLASDF
jgi:hypothetical protein